MPLVQHDIVERPRLEHQATFALDPQVEQEAAILVDVAIKYLVQHRGHAVGHQIGQESEPPEIDAEQADVMIDQGARRAEEGTVAADDDDQLAGRPQPVTVPHLQARIGHQRGALGVEQNAHRASGQIVDELPERLRDARVTVLGDDADGAEHAGRDAAYRGSASTVARARNAANKAAREFFALPGGEC